MATKAFKWGSAMKRGQLDDLLVFATIARARSFTRAAAELNLSPSALSHILRSLETRLGVRLLARTTRSVAPTPDGEWLLRSVESALKELEAGLGAISERRGDLSGSIKITTCQFAAHAVLAPVLPRFLFENPKISVEISVDGRLIDLVRDGFDAGIRWGQHLDQDMIAVRVGPDTRMIVVAAPAYLERNPLPHSPTDLKRHNCISCRLLTRGGTFPWKLERDGEAVRTETEGQLILDDPDVAVNLIVAGAGLGLVLEPKASSHMKAGRLVQVLDEWSVPFEGPHLYYPSRHVTPALRALIEVLKWKPSASTLA